MNVASASGRDGRPVEPKQQYIDDMVRRRGYVLDYHKFMANADYETLVAANGLVEAAYLRQRTLDRRTKELLFILSLTVMRADKHHLQSHMRVALELGVTPMEILEAVEIALPEAGVVVFQSGFEAWREVVGAQAVEPSPDVLAALSGDHATTTSG
jgi:4-carboxymuconolactone decarboxylase